MPRCTASGTKWAPFLGSIKENSGSRAFSRQLEQRLLLADSGRRARLSGSSHHCEKRFIARRIVLIQRKKRRRHEKPVQTLRETANAIGHNRVPPMRCNS